MKYLNLIFIMFVFLFFASCIDEEGKKMMLFVNKIVEEPDRMKEIIDSSEYYNSTLTEQIDVRIYKAFIDNIKSFKNNGIQYHYDEYSTPPNSSVINNKFISIGSGDIIYDIYLQFSFEYIDNKWVLKYVRRMNGY